MTSVMPASTTTMRPPRSRTWRTRATTQPARATSARPGSIARRMGRRSPGTVASRSGSSRGEPGGVGDGSSAGSTGNPPPTSSVSNSGLPGRRSPTNRETAPDGIAPRIDGPELRADVELDATSADRVAAVRADPLDDAGGLGLGEAELRRAGADRQTRQRLGVTSGLSRTSTSSGGRPFRPRPARRARSVSASASSADSMATQRSGSPFAAARTAARRSASVLPTPSSVSPGVWHAARRATAHSPRETQLAPKPRSVTSATTATTSLALIEYCRIQGSGNASRTAIAARSSVATSVTWTGVPYRVAAMRSDSARPRDGRLARGRCELRQA
jgi:hypothetical protein